MIASLRIWQRRIVIALAFLLPLLLAWVLSARTGAVESEPLPRALVEVAP